MLHLSYVIKLCWGHDGAQNIYELPKLLLVYYAYSYSIMQYGIVFWGASEAALQGVYVAQKKLVRCLAGERYWPAQERLCSFI
jgi:hypothetical protein